MQKIKQSFYRRIVVVIGVLVWLTAVAPMSVTHADSLWSDAAPTSVIFGDQRARAVGDILTIIISESSTAARTGSSGNTKSATVNTDKGTGLLGFIPTAASIGENDSFKTQGSINNSNTVTARISVKVIEVKPNGDLVVSGTQNIRQNGEEQRIVVSGQVRPIDILPNNSILSSKVADAKILVTGSGPLVNKQRQGILTQVFNWFF
ncbi:MAG: flgH [Firmicutes bacterium]|nr:flgH [Bacillota bacterium]